MNCDQLKQIHIGDQSFYCFESFECKNLSSLISIHLDDNAFYFCQSIVFESMNDWMTDEWDLNRLESIILGWEALYGDNDTATSNEMIMKSINRNDN